MFNIGDEIVYPMHGAGIIVDIEEKKILGELHKYYILQISISDMKVMLPVNNTETIGIRRIVSENAANDAIDHFLNCEEDENNNWNQRYRENIEKMKSGNLIDVATVAKTLLLRDSKKSLSNAERKMLSNAKNILISELVLAKGMTADEIKEILAI
ncbi:MAG: CarD family transcriptional regulator [Clostridia bacterium]|nr:CarD family transcriptional regulator [Clostridia bacterium]